MQIIDAHHHLWNPVSREPDVGYVWLSKIGAPKPFGDPTPIQRDYLYPEFSSECSGLVGSVHVQADGAIADPVLETAFIQGISDEQRAAIAIVAFVDLARADAEAVIQRHCEFANVRGVRQIISRLEGRPELSFAAEPYLFNKLWQRNFALLARYELSFDLQLYPQQMADAYQLLRDFPETKVIIDHAGSPYDQSVEGLLVWQRGLRQLAQLPNCAIKLSGFGMYDRNWDGRSLVNIVQTIDELFGAERTMFGSNYPVEKLARPYAHLLEQLGALYADSAGREAVFRTTAERWYRMRGLGD